MTAGHYLDIDVSFHKKTGNIIIDLVRNLNTICEKITLA